MSLKYWRTVCSLGSLAGIVGFAGVSLPALAGENIIFSAPPKALALPMVERQVKDEAQPVSVSLANFAPTMDPGIEYAPSSSVILMGARTRKGRNSERNNSVRDNLDGDRNLTDRDMDLDSGGDPSAPSDDRNIGNSMYGRSDFDSAYNRDDGPDGTSRAGQWNSAQRGFSGVTNRWDLEKSWSSSSSRDSTRARHSGYETDKDRASRGSELGAWAVRSGSDDHNDDEDSDSTSTKKGSGLFHSSLFSRTFGSRSSFWDKAKGEGADRFKVDDNKSVFRWSDGTTPTSAGFGSADWFQHDSANISGATAGDGFESALQASAPKADDQLGGVGKGLSAFEAPGLGGSGYADSLPKQDFLPPSPVQAPEAPAVLPLPKMPGSVFR